MNKLIFKTACCAAVGLLVPTCSFAQLTGEVHSLQSVLDQLYTDMIPLCSQLIGVGRGLAGFAALWYISSRVWRHLANAESIDFYPLLRPFALGLCIMMFPTVIQVLNGILSPTVTGTAAMVNNSNQAIAYLLQMKEDAVQKSPMWQMYQGQDGNGDYEKWYKYTHPDGEEGSVLEEMGIDVKFHIAKLSYSFRNSIKQWLSEVLHILFEAAALCINTIRTFFLIVMAILGPLIFGFAVFDGFQHTLTSWLARYINIFMWLPVANIFGSIIGKIQENMLRMDIEQIQLYGDTFFSSADTAYLIFMVIGIVGYFTIPSVASYIVHAGGANTLLFKSSNFMSTSAQSMISGGAAAASASAVYLHEKFSSTGNQDSGNSHGYMHNKLSGKD